jgi:signal transduction histidine kinase
MAARYGEREARLFEAALTLTLDRELPAVLRRLVALAAELTGASWCGLGVFGANSAVVDVIATGPRMPGSERQDLPAPGPGVLRIPVKVRDTLFGDLCVAGKQDAPQFDEHDQRVLEVLAAHAGVAIENAALLAEAEGNARRLQALREVAAKLLAGSPLDELLELIASHAMRLARAATGSAVIPGAREGTLVIEAVAGQPSELRGLVLPVEESLAGQVIQTGRTEVIANLSVDPRAFQQATQLGEGPGPSMFVPLRAGGVPFGALVVARNLGEPGFADPDVELVEGFADLAAVAFEYQRVHGELRRLAVMEERERIARELHDGAIQALFAVGMGLQATAARTGEPEVTSRLQGAVSELDRVISDLRSYIFGLRPGVLAGRQVDQALRRLAEEIAAPAGVTTVVEVEEQVAIALGGHATDLVQLVREALANVARHARATTCRVSLYWRQASPGARPGRTAVLEVDDDGEGFDPTATHAGHGLGNLRDRAVSLGGTLELVSSANEGTTVRVLIPM